MFRTIFGRSLYGMRRGLVGWGVGGLEGGTVALGEPISILVPEVVGCRLVGRLPAGTTATDLALTVTQAMRRHGVIAKVVEFFEARIQDLQKELAKFEQVKKFTLLPSAFSMELGELTPTMKLRRKIIEAKYQSEIEAMYNHV